MRRSAWSIVDGLLFFYRTGDCGMLPGDRSLRASTIKKIHTIVIGGGQSGLCASYHLAQQGIEHLVLERARVGERWQSERWDSLRFQFPNRYLRLPGLPYDGDEPEAFMHRDGVIAVIERYAQHINAPLKTGVNVASVEQDGNGGFVLDAGEKQYLADNVILATGPYQKTLVPDVAKHLPGNIYQLTASAYTNADALPAGGGRRRFRRADHRGFVGGRTGHLVVRGKL